MFIDKEWKKETSKIPDSPQEVKQKNYAMYFVVGVFALGALFLLFILMKDPENKGAIMLPHESGSQSDENASSTPGLPQDVNNNEESQYQLGTSTDSIRAEDLSFGHFYKEPKSDFVSTLKSYDLPINVKVDVSNYYDVSRKMNLDPYIDSLNKNGFAVIDAPVSMANSDFFSAYRHLLDLDIPVLLSEDFILYYYQNTLKQVFKEIEKNSFYETVWNINKTLYDISLARYKRDLEEMGMVNDPVLEGERLELAFFAVALKLLAPMDSQVNNANFSDDSKFAPQESEIFSFDMPDYLVDDVNAEVELIRQAFKTTKSPVMLYQRDYNEFFVPRNYKNNEKLKNFYITMKWMNTVFPMYPRDGNCENCLLDQSDWIINMVAAGNIAKDFYEDQELKNQWAIIYKFISFFSGLRSDLTYLNYYEVYSEIFGEDYNIRNIFSRDNKNRDEDIAKIQEALLEYEFSDLEGGLKRDSVEQKPLLGMRILQDFYWPNRYLLNQLVGKDMINHGQEGYKQNFTYCQERYSEQYYRCNGFSYDLLNMLYPFSLDSVYFYNNTNYAYYDQKISDLRKEIKDFDYYTWNNNIYWVTLDIAQNLLKDNRDDRPVYTRSQAWLEQKDYNTFLSIWANLHLPDDLFVSYYESDESNLGSYLQCNQYNYVEPNIDLVEDLIARNNMLVKMLKILEIGDKTSTASAALKELNKKLSGISLIIQKELSNEKLDGDDCRFITDMIRQVIKEKGAREFYLNIDNGLVVRKMKESIKGFKFLAVIYQHEGRKIISIGPAFDFKEN